MFNVQFLFPQIHLTPLEVAIIGMQDKIQSLRRTLEQYPPDGKLLQMQLQGGIATAVNQVCYQGLVNCLSSRINCGDFQGPFHIAQLFLSIPTSDHTHLHRRLKVCFKDFTRRFVAHSSTHADNSYSVHVQM